MALKPHPMLQSVVQGAPVLASALVQLASLEAGPPAPPVAVPAPPPPAPVVDISPAPPLVVETPSPPAVVDDDVVLEVVLEVPVAPAVPVPLSVLLEQPDGTQT